MNFHLRQVPVAIVLGLAFVLGGCATTRQAAFAPVVARFFLEADLSEPGRAVVLPQSGVAIHVAPKPVLMEFDLLDAQIAEVSLGRCLAFQLSLAAGRDLYRLSGTSQGSRLVLTLNDEVVGARRIDQPIDNGQLLVFVEIDDAKLPALVESLQRTIAETQRQLARKR